MLVFVAVCLALAHVHHDGAVLTGDETHYMVAALAIGRFHTLHVAEAYRYAIAHNLFMHWGVTFGQQAIDAGRIQVVVSHNGYFPFHELGVPFLLALPVAIGGAAGAEVAFAAVVAVLTATVAFLVGRVSRVRTPWRSAVVGVFLSPAFILASTQIYPDLVSGLIVTIVVLCIATIEIEGHASLRLLVVMGVLIGYLPWLHNKNLIFAGLLSGAVAAVCRQRKLGIRSLCFVAVPAVALWVPLLAYNLYVFDNPIGIVDSLNLGMASWTRMAALLVDRRQGIVVQMPAVLFGIGGLWLFRRRTPLAVLATVVCLPLVIFLNGTLANSFGGFSFAGRFQWEAAPLLLAFAGLALVRMAQVRPQAALLMAAVLGVLYVIEWIPIVASQHVYYNLGFLDPDSYKGWWGALDPFSPILGDFARPWSVVWHGGRVWLGVAFVLAMSVLVVYLVVRLSRDSAKLRLPIVGSMVALLAVMGVATTLAAAPLPSPDVIPAADLNSTIGRVDGTARVVQGPSQSGALVFGPSWPIAAGRYVASFTYDLQDPKTQRADVLISGGPPASTSAVVATAQLKATRGLAVANLPFTVVRKGKVQFRVFWTGSGRLRVTSVALTVHPAR